VRQLLTESILLGLLAGALGLALAVWGVGAIPSLYPGDLGSVRLSWVHLGFTVVVAMVTGLLFGLLPARRGSRPDLRSVLQRNLSGAGGRVRWLGFRQLLVTTEVALALVLLIGAGLLIRSFVGLSRLDPGFRTENLLTLCLELPETRYATGSEQVGFYETLLETIRAGAGDQLVGVTATTGLASGLDAAVGRPEIEGRPADPSSPPQFVVIVAAMSDYFRTMGIPLRSGRGFTTGDREATEPVIVINETLAERCLPGESPLGRRIRFNEQWYRIVGVVADMRLPDLVASGVGELQVYFPAHQAPDPRMTLVVRTTGDPGPLAGTLKARLWSIDPQVAVTRVATGDALLASSLASHRFNALLMVLFSAVAALLAVVGVYGVVAHSVSRSTHEIGIRLALGATSGDILGHLIRRSMAAVALGLAAGVAAALALARALAGLLHDVSARDPATFAVLTVLVATLALVATWIPARRATRLDPLGALRRECRPALGLGSTLALPYPYPNSEARPTRGATRARCWICTSPRSKTSSAFDPRARCHRQPATAAAFGVLAPILLFRLSGAMRIPRHLHQLNPAPTTLARLPVTFLCAVLLVVTVLPPAASADCDDGCSLGCCGCCTASNGPAGQSLGRPPCCEAGPDSETPSAGDPWIALQRPEEMPVPSSARDVSDPEGVLDAATHISHPQAQAATPATYIIACALLI